VIEVIGIEKECIRVIEVLTEGLPSQGRDRIGAPEIQGVKCEILCRGNERCDRLRRNMEDRENKVYTF